VLNRLAWHGRSDKGSATYLLRGSCCWRTCGGRHIRARQPKTTLRIFDPTGHIHAQVTLSGIVRRQTAVTYVNYPRGTGRLLLVFNRAGRTDFCRLTQGLARRGARLHNHHEVNAFEVNGHIYLRPYVDYRYYPNGLCGLPDLQMQMKLVTAGQLARLLR
jgi:hypothetical protein